MEKDLTTNAPSANMSETSKHRDKIIPHLPLCDVLDIGYGGDKVVPWAIACDMAQGSYTNVGNDPQQLGFDCRNLPFKDETLNACFASHLLEDWTYRDQVAILNNWKRCLRHGGVIIILGPDQKRFEAHCARTGQSLNDNHKEPDHSLATFKSQVWPQIQGDMVWVEGRDLEDYSFLVVLRKL